MCNPHPHRGILPFPNKLYPAIAPRRRRIPSGAARERSSHAQDGTKLVRTRTCTNSTHIHPLIKVLLELERTSSFSKATVPPFPVLLPIAQQLRYFAKVKPYFSARAAKVPSAIRSFMDLLNSGQRSEFWRKATPYSSLVSSAATTRSA